MTPSPLILVLAGLLPPGAGQSPSSRLFTRWLKAAVSPTNYVFPPIRRSASVAGQSTMTNLVIVFVVLRSAEFLGESDEKPFRPADVAEPIRVFVLNYFAYELCAALAESFKCLVDVVHCEHDAEVA